MTNGKAKASSKRGRPAKIPAYEAIATCIQALDAVGSMQEKQRVLLALVAYTHGEDTPLVMMRQQVKPHLVGNDGEPTKS